MWVFQGTGAPGTTSLLFQNLSASSCLQAPGFALFAWKPLVGKKMNKQTSRGPCMIPSAAGCRGDAASAHGHRPLPGPQSSEQPPTLAEVAGPLLSSCSAPTALR